MPRPFRLKAPQPSENDVEKGCLQLLWLRGWWPIRLHAGTFKSLDGRRFIKGVEKGTPDYAALHPDHPGFLLETKRPSETLQPHQFEKINQLQSAYRLQVAVVCSAEELHNWLNNHEGRQTR